MEDFAPFSVSVSLLMFLLRLLLCPNEFGVVNESVLVNVVHLKNRVDQCHQFLVREDLFLHLWCLWLVVIVSFFAALFCRGERESLCVFFGMLCEVGLIIEEEI